MSLSKISKSFIIDFSSGGLAGLIGKLIICPIDKIKILLQTQNYIDNSKDTSKYNQLINYLLEEIKQKGISSLWVGNTNNITKYVMNQAFNFGIKGQIQKIIKNKILCGGVTGILSSVILFPFDFVKIKLITDKNNDYKGFIDCIYKNYEKKGLKSIFNGLGISMFGNFCYRGLYFGLNDIGKKYFLNNGKQNSFIKKYLFAQSVSFLSETITYPIDTVRKQRILNKNNQNNNIVKCIKNIYRKNGIKDFYNGIYINSLRTIGSSFVLLFFEKINNNISNRKFL